MEQNKVKTLGELRASLDSTAKSYPVLDGENLGHRTLKFSLPLSTFISMSAVGNRSNVTQTEVHRGQFQAQRELVREHAVGLAKYTLMGLVRSEIKDREAKGKLLPDEILMIQKGLGNPAYASLQPIVCNIRDCEPNGDDLEGRESSDGNPSMFFVTLSARHLLWVVDGQHRREGFDMVLSFLTKVKNTYRYPKRGLYEPINHSGEIMSETVHDFWLSVYEWAVTRCHVAIECHLGLQEQEEQQLFFDLNSKGRKVVQSLAFQYDHTDPINSFVAKELIENEILPFKPADKDETNWHKDDGRLARKDINNVTALLCLGKTTSRNATPALVESRFEFMTRFWESVAKIKNFGEEGAKSKTLAAQPVVLKALAKISYELVYGHQNIVDHDGYKTLITAIGSGGLDFSHENPIWRALMMPENARRDEFPGLENYLYVPAEVNLDAGMYDHENGWVRFGNKHNDIYPRLGDVIRWKLQLKVRPTVAKALEARDD